MRARKRSFCRSREGEEEPRGPGRQYQLDMWCDQLSKDWPLSAAGRYRATTCSKHNLTDVSREREQLRLTFCFVFLLAMARIDIRHQSA